MGEIFYCYYENSNGDKVIINSRTKEIKTYGYEEYKMFNKSKTIYHMMKGFDANEEGLRQYVNYFKEWTTELKNNKVLNIDIFRYYNLYIAVEMTFKRLCKGKYESHDKITEKERQWQEKCYNGALTYCDDSAIDLITECFTYDYSSQYPKILASNSFFIPTKEGKEYKLKKLPDMKGMKTGYYHVRITCNDKEFKKLFSFSEDDVYTDRSLYQAMKHQKEFNVKIELVTDVEYNSYLYDDDCLVSGSKIFGGWFKKLSELKKLFPKNPIIKFMSSAIWGFICKKTPIYKSEQEITNENLDVGAGKNTKRRYRIIKQYFNHGTPGKYELSDRQQGQKYNIRIKSFLTAYSRNKTSRLATGNVHFNKTYKHLNETHDLSNVVRIHTDAVTFRTRMEDLVTVEDLKLEKKSTGLIIWKNVNAYTNLTLELKSFCDFYVAMRERNKKQNEQFNQLI